MNEMRQTIKIGVLKGNKLVDVEIEIKTKKCELTLSICGNIHNPRRTDYDTCGQINDTIKELLDNGKFKELYVHRKELETLLKIWDEWHLNDVHAECIHQTALMTYIRRRGQDLDYEELLTVPELKKCPVCGYEYGRSWNTVPLPDDVVEFIYDFLVDYRDA